MSSWQTEPVNQPAQNQTMKTRLTFWSSQFPISAYHTTTSALQLWRSRRGKIENVPIFTEAAQSSHEYNLNIHFVSLPSQDLLRSPWKQTALGLSRPFLEVTEYRTTELHLLPLSPPNRTTSVTSPWSYAVSFLFQRSNNHVNSQAYTVIIHSYCMTL